MNAYGKYQRSRNASWQCLIDCKVDSLPVSPALIASQLGVGLYQYGPNAALLRSKGLGALLDAYGFAFAEPDGRLLIFYNEQKPHHQIRFTVAHELGHILLGHVAPEAPCGRLLIPSDPSLERQADQFAIRLLAPACMLWHLDAYSAEDISKACDISMDAAVSRARRMKVLRKRDAWLHSPLEQQLYHQFTLKQ